MRDYEPYYTEDGSIGLYSYGDKDVYHSKYGALTEAWEKFVIPSGINKLINKKNQIKVLDICYGIGYNTKALMTFIIENQKNKIRKKTIIEKIKCIVAKYTNKNTLPEKEDLSEYNETVCTNNDISLYPYINIDCMDINEELIKLSPLFKTIKTPGEIYSDIVPDILNCFDTYYKIKSIFVNFLSFFYPRNKKDISDLLEIKFKNMHIEKEYKVNNIVNYILLNRLYDVYGKDYFNKEFKKIIRERYTKKFLDKNMIKYAKFNHIFGYNFMSDNILSTFLHNIYYQNISQRNKNINFKLAENLFKVNFMVNDARKSILQVNYKYDCIFLDAFTYTKAPQLWSVEFINALGEHLNDTGVILTYSNSAQIRNTFLENGFYVGKIYNDKTEKYMGTIASKDKSRIKYPLNNYEIGLCNTKAGIPYHDPNLAFSAKEIMELREYEFRHSNLLSSSKYMKLRSLRSEESDEE